jgi:hypothetical protein
VYEFAHAAAALAEIAEDGQSHWAGLRPLRLLCWPRAVQRELAHVLMGSGQCVAADLHPVEYRGLLSAVGYRSDPTHAPRTRAHTHTHTHTDARRHARARTHAHARSPGVRLPLFRSVLEPGVYAWAVNPRHAADALLENVPSTCPLQAHLFEGWRYASLPPRHKHL